MPRRSNIFLLYIKEPKNERPRVYAHKSTGGIFDRLVALWCSPEMEALRRSINENLIQKLVDEIAPGVVSEARIEGCAHQIYVLGLSS